MKQKTQTLIKDLDGNVVKRIDGFLYQPLNTIIIEDVEWHEWKQYDEFDCNGCLVREIWLKEL